MRPGSVCRDFVSAYDRVERGWTKQGRIDVEDAKNKVKAQYGSVGDAYVKSVSHASGDDLPRMLELATLQGTERMLDIATGGGHVVHILGPHVGEVVASDLTPEILVHAAQAFEEWGLTNVSTTEADAESMPFPDASFDLITCRIAPHHFPDPSAFIGEVARVLRPDGQFLLVDSTVPDGDDGVFFNKFEAVRDHSHVRSLTIEEWLELCQQHHLEVTHVESYRKRHDFEDWVARSRTSTEDRERLIDMMLGASPERQALFRVEIVEGHLVAFSDTKTLFRAVPCG